MPVLYEQGKPRSDSTRRLLTNKVTAQLAPNADAGTIAAAVGASGFELPDYAPGYAIFLAGNPLAAPALAERLSRIQSVLAVEPQLARLHSKRTMPNDPLVSQQWHLKNSSSTRTHLNVESVWAYGGSGGYRGSGIRIGIVDDGVQTAHPDLAANVDTTNDKDWNGNDSDPNPGTDDDHGTSVAGVAAARGNNTLGVAGTAPEATIVGLRLIADYVTDSQEAEAMAWKKDIIQIKNNSWGPEDSGTILEGPGLLTRAALAEAAANGRGGRGSIFVWSAGNGGDIGDNSNYDGYANSIYTIAIGATDNSGNQAYYSEPGANLIVCAPSSGTSLGITTTDRTGSAGYNTASSATGGDYTDDFGGTSSAAPAAAGVIALLLQRNPNLGWRDVQEILIRSAFKVKPTDSGWTTNAAGISFHHDFGAGLLDASTAVSMAATWTNLAPAQSVTSTQSGLSVSIPNNNTTGITRSFDFSSSALRVEHVTVRVNINHTARGNLEITLTSPSGMSSRLAEVHNDSGDNFSDWMFSSVRHWGEPSTGTWTLKIADRSSTGNTTGGTLTSAEVVIHGTPSPPANQPPSISSVTLNATSQAFADSGLSVASVSASDPESDPITLAYQWQSSTDGTTFQNEPGATTPVLSPAPPLAGKLWRCVVTASDGTNSSTPFSSSSVNLLHRPPASIQQGASLNYDSGLVLRGSPTASYTRQAIINEFSQGPSGGNSEWVEILTLKPGSLALWKLQDSNSGTLVFQNLPVWNNIPAGTLIVIYNGGATKDPLLPADDLDPSDGTMVISSSNSTCFDQSQSSWIALSNSGDAIYLRDAGSNEVFALSYGNNTSASPRLGTVGSGQAARFTSDNETAATQAASWEVVPSNINQITNPAQDGVTPAAGNTASNSAFVSTLRSPSGGSPALYRLGTGSILPHGLSLDPNTGTLSGTLSLTATPGSYPITIERYNTLGETVSFSFTLQALAANTFASWIAGYPGVGSQSGRLQDFDGDHLANIIENILGSHPDSPNHGLVASPSSAGQLSLRHDLSNTIASDVSYDYQWSTDLVHWFASGETNASGVQVVISVATITDRAAPDNDEVEVTAHVISGSPSRLFLRLRAW